MNKNANDDIHKNVSAELGNILEKFVERLALVRHAVIDLGITIEELRTLGPSSWIQKKIPQSGTWGTNNEWRYFFHGRGCRLINKESGEILDWESSNKTGFDIDPYAFLRYLNWKIEKGETTNYIRNYLVQGKGETTKLLPIIQRILETFSEDNTNNGIE